MLDDFYSLTWLFLFCFHDLQAELNQAIAMISYYASSSEPAQVRGKTVYLQYSNRQEIVNNKTTADVAGNVLLVTIEGNDARLVSIDVLHLVSNWASSTWTQSMEILWQYKDVVLDIIVSRLWYVPHKLYLTRVWMNQQEHAKEISSMAAYCIGRKSTCVFVFFLLP